MTTEEFKRIISRLQPRLQRVAERIVGDPDSCDKLKNFSENSLSFLYNTKKVVFLHRKQIMNLL